MLNLSPTFAPVIDILDRDTDTTFLAHNKGNIKAVIEKAFSPGQGSFNNSAFLFALLSQLNRAGNNPKPQTKTTVQLTNVSRIPVPALIKKSTGDLTIMTRPCRQKRSYHLQVGEGCREQEEPDLLNGLKIKAGDSHHSEGYKTPML